MVLMSQMVHPYILQKKKKKKLNFFGKKSYFILTKKVLKNIVKVIQVI